MYDFYMHGMLEYEDDVNILIENQKFSDKAEHIDFTYDFSDPRLVILREKYNLDKIAGKGSVLTRLTRITFWLAKTLQFGTSQDTDSFHALEVLEKTKRNYKSNCFVAATTLTECFLAMNYIARMVRCMPLDLRFNECHCMTIAYVSEYKKFIAFDAAMGGYYIDESGNPMSIPDIITALVNRRTVKMRSIFINNDFVKNIEVYLAKNLIRFQSHKNTMYGNEITGKSDIMINLNPVTLPIKNKTVLINDISTQHIFIYNREAFWEDNKTEFNII